MDDLTACRKTRSPAFRTALRCSGFRPLATTPKPIDGHAAPATVVGPAGQEIFTDKYGADKDQFHWDRSLKFDSDSSCWVRVAMDIAGNKWGTMYIPRIGQEVIVDFLHGRSD